MFGVGHSGDQQDAAQLLQMPAVIGSRSAGAEEGNVPKTVRMNRHAAVKVPAGFGWKSSGQYTSIPAEEASAKASPTGTQVHPRAEAAA